MIYSKSQVTLASILVLFERAYAVPHSRKIHSQGLTGPGCMTGEKPLHPSVYLMSKIPGLLGFNEKEIAD